MKNKKLILIISALSLAVVLIGSVTCYKAFYNNSEKDAVKVLGYREAEGVNVNGHLTTRYEKIHTQEWIDSDNIIIVKENGEFDNPGMPIDMRTISKYNLNSREVRDYDNVIMDSSEFHGVSKSGRYALYGEPRVIPEVESAEWKKAEQTKELFHEKRDILDLETGEIIQDFDKVVNNCSAKYMWMDNDLIFVDYGSEWHILDMKGNILKVGTFTYENCASNYTTLVDVDELKVSDEGISGCFYYVKDYMGEDKSLGSRLYSMDVNTLEEKQIYSSDHAMNYQKHGDNFVHDYYNNNGGPTDEGIFKNRTFAFRAANKEGTLLQECGFPEGRNYFNLELSPDGSKCAFVEVNAFDIDNKEREKDTSNNTLKVMDLKTGEVKDIAKVDDLMDKDNEEDFVYKGEYTDLDGNVREMKSIGPYIFNIQWDKTGDSLTFNYQYTPKGEKAYYTDTYVVTFDK